jgi:transcriptional regulator with XRE-family HTH domain
MLRRNGKDDAMARPPRHFPEIGLDYVWLSNGWEEADDGSIVVEDLDLLVGAVALLRAAYPSPLSGQEVRFFRERLGLGQDDLAALLGLAPEAVAGWERCRFASRTPEDGALRALWMERAGVSRAELPPLDSDPYEMGADGRVLWRRTKGGEWVVANKGVRRAVQDDEETEEEAEGPPPADDQGETTDDGPSG